jgi:hypothetical protein
VLVAGDNGGAELTLEQVDQMSLVGVGVLMLVGQLEDILAADAGA